MLKSNIDRNIDTNTVPKINIAPPPANIQKAANTKNQRTTRILMYALSFFRNIFNNSELRLISDGIIANRLTYETDITESIAQKNRFKNNENTLSP